MSKNSVKDALTARHQNDEFAHFARRIVRAYARRIGELDIEALPDMVQLSTELDKAIADAVLTLRSTYSWAEIAARLNITRQAAQQRWGRHS